MNTDQIKHTTIEGGVALSTGLAGYIGIMSTPLEQKSSLEEIKKRFDNDVARFSNLEIGQSSTIDAPLAMELIAQAAVKSTTNIRQVLDIGCGAGNNTIKLLQYASLLRL